MRERLRAPPPQDRLHVVQSPQALHWPCSGQGRCSQGATSLDAEPQPLPPQAGAGLEHARVRRLVPAPQVAEHAPQLPNELHPPLTYDGLHSQCALSPVTEPTPQTDPPVGAPHELSRLLWNTRTV